MSHAQPGGVIVWGLAIATWALLALAAYGLYRTRARRARRGTPAPAEPPVTRITIQPRAIEPYDTAPWSAGAPTGEDPS